MPKTADNPLDRVIRRGAKLNQRGFTLYSMKMLHPPRPRIVISQKIDKRSVVRNRLRRQIRAILDRALPPNRAVVIIVRRELLGLSFTELQARFQSVLTQLQ